jgi:hypothetical protein
MPNPSKPDNSEFAKDAPQTPEQRAQAVADQATAKTVAKANVQDALTAVGDVLNTFSNSHGIGERQAFDKIFKTYGAKFPSAAETKARLNPDARDEKAKLQIPPTPKPRTGSRTVHRPGIAKAKIAARE